MPDFNAHAKKRLAKDVYPGWWLRTFAGTAEEWLKVTAVRNYKSSEPGKDPVTMIVVVDEVRGEAYEVLEWSNEYVLCCTKAEAKKAGVV